MSFELRRELVEKILGARSFSWQWTVQGFGMLRLYLGDAGRLHIWHRDLQKPDVSLVHTHFWPLSSEIICGRIKNRRATTVPTGPAQWWMQNLVTGEGGGLIGEKKLIGLRWADPEYYFAGSEYSQEPEEIHLTEFWDGTITLMVRPDHSEEKIARVFWPRNGEWGSAEPRPATMDEVEKYCTFALDILRGEKASRSL